MVLTAERARVLFTYNRLTGDLITRTPTERKKVGHITRSCNRDGYYTVHADGRGYLVHRVCWLIETGRWPFGDLDHADGVRTNNAITNLREATRSQNNANRSSHPGKLKGVTYHKAADRWMAQIKKDRVPHYLGLYDSAEEAHAVYAAKARELFGKFARVA